MINLDDEDLIKAYLKSEELELDPNFIRILESELQQRSINVHKKVKKE